MPQRAFKAKQGLPVQNMTTDLVAMPSVSHRILTYACGVGYDKENRQGALCKGKQAQQSVTRKSRVRRGGGGW